MLSRYAGHSAGSPWDAWIFQHLYLETEHLWHWRLGTSTILTENPPQTGREGSLHPAFCPLLESLTPYFHSVQIPLEPNPSTQPHFVTYKWLSLSLHLQGCV